MTYDRNAQKILLAEQAELAGLYKRFTEPDAAGMSLAEVDAMEQAIAKYPHLYEQYRKTATQAG